MRSGTLLCISRDPFVCSLEKLHEALFRRHSRHFSLGPSSSHSHRLSGHSRTYVSVYGFRAWSTLAPTNLLCEGYRAIFQRRTPMGRKAFLLIVFLTTRPHVTGQKTLWWCILTITLVTYLLCIGTRQYSYSAFSCRYIYRNCSKPRAVHFQLVILKLSCALDVATDFLSISYLQCA